MVSLENIYRVKGSLKYIQDDIGKASNADIISNEIKSLLKNYKLKDNIINSLSCFDQSKREEAKSHAITALEDLTQAYEYFSDGTFVENTTPLRDILVFTMEATNAGIA
jgi:hypothetical protein